MFDRIYALVMGALFAIIGVGCAYRWFTHPAPDPVVAIVACISGAALTGMISAYLAGKSATLRPATQAPPIDADPPHIV